MLGHMLVSHPQRISYTVFTAFILLSSSVGYTATPNWQGPYIGGYVGGGVGNNQVSTRVGPVTGSSYFTTITDVNAVNSAGSSTKVPITAIAGIQAGHDWLWKQMVYGIVADYSSSPLSSFDTTNKTYADNSANYSVYTAMSTNWLFTLRGRIGYPLMLRWPSLLYLTGGVAATKLNVHNSFSDNSSLAGSGGNNASENQFGWTGGVGIELASFGHATIDLEYMYVQVPSVKATSTISNSAAGFGVPAQSLRSPFTTTGSFSANLLRLGINYRFDE